MSGRGSNANGGRQVVRHFRTGECNVKSLSAFRIDSVANELAMPEIKVSEGRFLDIRNLKATAWVKL